MWNKFKKYKIVQLARVPCANSGYHLSNLINNYSQYFESRYILGSHYSKKMMNVVPFRLFPYDLFWEEQKDLCFKVIQEADIIHIHHGFYCDEDWMINLLKDKKVVTTIYDLSLIDNQNYFNRKRKISNLLTIADQPAQKRVFQGISDVLCPLVNYLYNEAIELKYNDKPIVIYAPTNRYPRNNGSSKGYYEVTQIIKELQDEALNFEFDLIEGLSYADNLERKKKGDIFIDDIINETWHNTSLEATFFGAIPITSYTGKDYPFIYANLKTLKEVLKFYITHHNELKEKQIELIKWRKEFLNPQRLIEIYENIYFSLFKTKEEKLEKIINLPLKIMKKESSLEFMDILCKLNEYNIKFCVLNETCLYAAKFKDFKENVKEINLGLFINNKIIELFKNLGWNYDGINFTKNNLKIYINSLPNNTKQWNIKNIPINVPMPLVGYLDRLYGKDWSK